MRRARRVLIALVIAAGLGMATSAPAQAQTCPIDRLITTGSCW